MDIPVLIIGGGPTGLIASIALSRFGVPSLLVERHPASSTFPKGRALSLRTMEVLRRYGLAERVAAAGVPRTEGSHFFFGSSLTAPDHVRNGTTPDAERAPLSPALPAICSQDVLEPLLRAHAESLGPGTVRFGCEAVELAQDADGVTVRLADRDGHASVVRAAHVIGADGAAGFTRRAVGIGMSGDTALTRNLNILFEADLRAHVADRLSLVYTIASAELTGTFMTVDNARRWLFNLVRDPARPGQGEPADIVRRAAGVPGLAVEVVATQEWTAAALLADRYRDGRVFLAGDAVHPMTPYGGFGMNCAIQDADNLAWKLAAVHHGWAGPGLLNSYEAERRPVGADTVAESRRSLLATLDSTALVGGHDGDGDNGPRPTARPSDGLVLGYAYDRPGCAVVPDGTAPPGGADPIAVYRPTARPGHRLPHHWTGGDRLSTLDLVGTGFTLLTGPKGQAWHEAEAPGVPLRAHTVDDDVADALGIGAEGALLVRPDDQVAWRTGRLPADPAAELSEALAVILGS
ncbi:FAD-dependent monooxygenase [Nonomuraea longicatena]|uniref:FAD-dependent monooxygenase n=1 Tax=Nonomuraea longicatena TaxID=83682 RepID=A0ABP3ZBL6_9ACTN